MDWAGLRPQEEGKGMRLFEVRRIHVPLLLGEALPPLEEVLDRAGLPPRGEGMDREGRASGP